MSDTRPSVTIRMPSPLMEKVKESAKKSGRSMNAEIVNLLETALTVSGEAGAQVISSLRLLDYDDVQSIVGILNNAANRLK